jgi:glycosyltransferase involved in cell wall biosynthesis
VSSAFERTRRQIERRARQIRVLSRTEGVAGISRRLRRAAARWFDPEITPLPVRPADVKAADLSSAFRPKLLPVEPDGRLSIHWVMTPPAESSGGHTTIFRILKHLQAAGHRNHIYFYDVYGADLRYHESLVRSVYGFDGPVDEYGAGMSDAHAVIATSWPTAYAVYNARCAGKRFYFVQDFEPYFFPVGGLSAMAEATYRMGFHGITAGRWLAQKLRHEFGMEADAFDFGCDTARYRRDPDAERRGIAFYARHEAPRRAFELGIMALELFHEERPDIELHFYGQEMRGRVAPLPIVDHGEVSPDRLNEIYNRCYGALSLSMTNVSLVPHEMLAAGCIPVVNDAEHNRIVLDNAHVRYAAATPRALADALRDVVSLPDFDRASAAAAASVASRSWTDAGRAVDRALREKLVERAKPAES